MTPREAVDLLFVKVRMVQPFRAHLNVFLAYLAVFNLWEVEFQTKQAHGLHGYEPAERAPDLNPRVEWKRLQNPVGPVGYGWDELYCRLLTELVPMAAQCEAVNRMVASTSRTSAAARFRGMDGTKESAT